MLIDGEKYACEACVRGHRVSNCQHAGKCSMTGSATKIVPHSVSARATVKAMLTASDTDRPLTHINKKGRPVSQCTHCRGLRKSRAAHVKCDCGDKAHSKGECVHAERGDSKSEQIVTMIPKPWHV